jgi:hypothetical protein
MAGSLFDVFVVGSTDPSAAGETRVASALSTMHGMPLATVTRALAGKNLRAGQGLDQAQAQALVHQLQGIGAVTVIRPAQARLPSPSPATRVPGLPPALSPPPVPPSPVPPSVPVFGRTMLAGSGNAAPWAGAPAGPPAPHDPFAPLSPSPPTTALLGGDDRFQPRATRTPSVATALSARPTTTPSPKTRPQGGSEVTFDSQAGNTKLELARRNSITDDELVAIKEERPSGSAGSLHEIGMRTASGVAVDQDPKNINLVRCVQHGLYYDKTKASGCRKCLSVGREYAMKIEAAKPEGFRLPGFREKPAKRAFAGLIFAIVLGFIPAAYYCFGPGSALASNLRVEQELLSRQIGSQDVLKRFDELDDQVSAAHGRTVRNTAIVWIAVASVAMFGWYKIT